MRLTRNKKKKSNQEEQAAAAAELFQKVQWKQGPINPVVLEEGSDCHMTGLKARHEKMHTFCRKMSEYMTDKERVIVGISWVLGTARRVSQKILKLLFSFSYKRLCPIVTACPV